MPKQKLRLQMIDWDDHWSFTRGTWRDMEEFQEITCGHHCRSIGYVVKETKKTITVVSTVSVSNEGEFQAGSGDMTILKSCIRRRRNLRA